MQVAAGGGHSDVFMWLRSQGCSWNASVSAAAAAGGHLMVLQWARSKGCPWNESSAEIAAKNGHLPVLQWAVANGCPCDRARLLQKARAGLERLGEGYFSCDLLGWQRQSQVVRWLEVPLEGPMQGL
jgi:hypothetical protein